MRPGGRERAVDAQAVAVLVGAGVAGGLVTAVVGGASLITFPVLLAAGLPPVLANASNTVALTPGNLAAAFADRERMPAWDRSLLGLAATAAIGSVAGAALLLVTPEKAFTGLVPALIGGATLLFACGDRVRRWSATRQAADPAVWPAGAKLLLFLPVAVYGGYFGAGMSVMLLAILSAGFFRDLRTANVAKNLLSGLTSLMAVIVFVSRDAVVWPPTVAMMAGVLVGGFAGGKLVRVLPAGWLRFAVIVVGAALTLVYARRYWMA